MKKSMKGALAGGAAAALLLGGAGTLAYWTDNGTIAGSTQIKSGTATLSTPDCSTNSGTHDWQLDGGGAYTPGTTLLVPGDSISKVCDMTLTLTGAHIGATLGIDTASLTDNGSSSLDTELVPAATFTVDGGTYSPITDPGTYTVRATITVDFDGPAATNASKNGDVNLSAIKVTATQTHS